MKSWKYKCLLAFKWKLHLSPHQVQHGTEEGKAAAVVIGSVKGTNSSVWRNKQMTRSLSCLALLWLYLSLRHLLSLLPSRCYHHFNQLLWSVHPKIQCLVEALTPTPTKTSHCFSRISASTISAGQSSDLFKKCQIISQSVNQLYCTIPNYSHSNVSCKYCFC